MTSPTFITLPLPNTSNFVVFPFLFTTLMIKNICKFNPGKNKCNFIASSAFIVTWWIALGIATFLSFINGLKHFLFRAAFCAFVYNLHIKYHKYKLLSIKLITHQNKTIVRKRCRKLEIMWGLPNVFQTRLIDYRDYRLDAGATTYQGLYVVYILYNVHVNAM